MLCEMVLVSDGWSKKIKRLCLFLIRSLMIRYVLATVFSLFIICCMNACIK